MNESTIKREIAVTTVHPDQGIIYLYATSDALEAFAKFGLVQPWNHYHRIDVDPRFDFQEVLTYIQAYNGTDE